MTALALVATVSAIGTAPAVDFLIVYLPLLMSGLSLIYFARRRRAQGFGNNKQERREANRTAVGLTTSTRKAIIGKH